MSSRRRRAAWIATALLAVALGALLAVRYRARHRPSSRAPRAQRNRNAPAPRDAATPERPLDAPPSPTPPRLFRLDPQHTGRSGYALPRAPRIRTRIETGRRINTQAALTDDGRLVFGSHDGVVYAADPATGRVAWRLATGDRIYASPFIAPSGQIYLGSDADRFFLLARTGALETALGTDDDADTSAVPAPDGSLRFAAGRMLYATEPDLTVRWRLEFGGKVFSSPAVLPDGTTLVGSQDDGVYAVDPAGAVRWRFATGGDVDATPAIELATNTAYVGSDDGHVYALDVTNGAVRWRAHVGGYVRAGAALGLDGNLVVGTFGPHTRVVALDRATGAARWSVPITGPPTRDYGVASSALVDRDGRYAVGTPDDALLIIERDGEVHARVALPADVDGSPVLTADGVLAVGCDDGVMYVLGD